MTKTAMTLAYLYKNAVFGGRMKGPKAGGPEGKCVCPVCGYSVSHNRAEPCTDKKCPKCDIALVRE